MKNLRLSVLSAAAIILSGCEYIETSPVTDESRDPSPVPLEDVAMVLSNVGIGIPQMREVHDAVLSSSDNGYDEEYMMTDLFSTPGAGVGDIPVRSTESTYENPLKELIKNYLESETKAVEGQMSADEFLSALESSDIQIYWPYSEDWDGKSSPVITFDPADGSVKNVGYELSIGSDGSNVVKKVEVDEEMARQRPVWVVNRNDDSGYTSLEMRRRQDPDWGKRGGGTISAVKSEEEDPQIRTLLLKKITARRNYDTWFAGASEFFVKMGSVEDFKASTEAELQLYSPAITDFMIVIKRSQIGVPIPFNAVLVSQWSDQLEKCALMITEDDGGTQDTWKCSAEVKIKSKTYGFDISIPFKTRDDIVWRGQLSRKYIEKNSDIQGHFGDVDLTFELVTTE